MNLRISIHHSHCYSLCQPVQNDQLVLQGTAESDENALTGLTKGSLTKAALAYSQAASMPPNSSSPFISADSNEPQGPNDLQDFNEF